MAWLGESTGESSELPTAQRRIKDQIEEQLFDRNRDLFSEIDLVFFDTTSIYFEGEGGATLGQRGFSKDHRPDLKQMIVGLAVDIHGWPICSPELIALSYKHLWTVEDLFRTMKTALATRPIDHKRDETILGHVFCSFLALRLRRELETRLSKQGKDWEWGEILRGLDNLTEVTLSFRQKEYALRAELTGQAGLALRAAGVALPQTLRELPPSEA